MPLCQITKITPPLIKDFPCEFSAYKKMKENVAYTFQDVHNDKPMAYYQIVIRSVPTVLALD